MVYFKSFKNKLAKLISWYGKKIAQNLFSDASTNSSDIKEEVTKQINTLKLFDMEPHKAIPKKHCVSEKENNSEEEINLTP